MELPVLIEPVPGTGYRIHGSEPFSFTAEGATREEAVFRFQQLCQARLTSGAELLKVDVGPTPHPWLPFAGMFKDDADFEEVREIMAENRQKMDQDPNVP